MTNRFEVIAVNDAASHCECCGRSGLQRVVWIADHETGEHKHFGTSCALRPAKGFDCVDEIKAAIKRHNDDMKRAIALAFSAYKAAGGTMISSCDANGSPIATVADVALWEACKAAQIERLAA
jgi:hypothetical protein